MLDTWKSELRERKNKLKALPIPDRFTLLEINRPESAAADIGHALSKSMTMAKGLAKRWVAVRLGANLVLYVPYVLGVHCYPFWCVRLSRNLVRLATWSSAGI